MSSTVETKAGTARDDDTSSSDIARVAGKPPGLRQSMSDLHIWAGLLAGWILYAMFLTGTVSYFKDEITQWSRPELPHMSEPADPAIVAQRVVDQMLITAAGSPQWGISLPGLRDNSASAFWRVPGEQGRRTFKEASFDPATGKEVTARQTMGGEFFYRFHFQFWYMPVIWGRWLAGVCAMFMLVAIVSGVITHKKIFIDFFTFRWGKGQRSWLDAHNALSVFGLPFHLMITYTGLVTLMGMYMPYGQQVAFKTPAERQEISVQLSAFLQPGKASGKPAALAPVEDMVKQAQARWGRDNISRITVTNPGDAAAQVSVSRGDEGRVSMSPQYMVFEGTTGKLVETRDSVGPAAETRGVMYALHLGRFGDTVMRWLYFVVSFAGTAMVGTGLVMWTVKRRQKLPDPTRGYLGLWLVERLNVAAIAGLSIAMAGFLYANRLLPQGLPKRNDLEVDVFFMVWGVALVHAFLRSRKKAWLEQLWIGAAVLALLPVVNMLTTDRPFWRSLAEGDWVFAGMDIMLWIFAALHAVTAMRVARHKARVKAPRKVPASQPAAGHAVSAGPSS